MDRLENYLICRLTFNLKILKKHFRQFILFGNIFAASYLDSEDAGNNLHLRHRDILMCILDINKLLIEHTFDMMSANAIFKEINKI